MNKIKHTVNEYVLVEILNKNLNPDFPLIIGENKNKIGKVLSQSPTFKKDDEVLISEFALFEEVMINGKNLSFIKEESVLAVIE